MSLIELVNVKKIFDKNTILFDNLNIKIDEGEFVGLVGKSGSGKSTLLNIIGLITKIDKGNIIINGEEKLIPKSKKALLLRRNIIGYLFQNYGLVDEETVKWNLLLSLEYKNLNKKEKIKLINEKLSSFGLGNFIDKKIYQLSGGEQQRIAIIKLILQESKIILADEPTSGLDKENVNAVMRSLVKLNKKGVTVIMVTHDVELYDYFSRIINVEELNRTKNEV